MEELPVRIEGFDISNLGGEHTVASMVVFEGVQVLDDLEADGLKPKSSSSRPTRRLCSTATRRPAAATRWPRKGERRRDPGRARAARAAARARRRGDGHQRPDRRRCCAGGSARRCWATREAKLALTLLTFGFKNGPPRDADLTLDVRFLPNPHYVDELRPLTGHDQAVREYVESGTQAGEFYGRLLPLLEFLVPAYVAEGKSHLTIAIGCTGGRHRSVTVADRIRRDLDGATTSSSASSTATRTG